MEKIELFNNSIYKTSYNFDFKMLQPIFEKMVDLKKQDHLEEGNTLTSWYSKVTPIDLDELNNFYEFITPIFNDVLINKWGYPKENDYLISNAWVSKYGKGGYIKPHAHDDITAVICAYIKIPKDTSNTMFRDPYYETKQHMSTKDDRWLWNEIKCTDNDVLIFQGGIVHKTEPNQSNENRWIMTTNIITKKKNINLI
jgi:hypothetical protein